MRPVALPPSRPERLWNRSTRSLRRLPPMIPGSPTACRLSLCVIVPRAHRSSTMSLCTEAMVFISATKEQSCCRSTFIYQALIEYCCRGSRTAALGLMTTCRVPPKHSPKGVIGKLGTRRPPHHVHAPKGTRGTKSLRHCRAFSVAVRRASRLCPIRRASMPNSI